MVLTWLACHGWLGVINDSILQEHINFTVHAFKVTKCNLSYYRDIPAAKVDSTFKRYHFVLDG